MTVKQVARSVNGNEMTIEPDLTRKFVQRCSVLLDEWILEWVKKNRMCFFVVGFWRGLQDRTMVMLCEVACLRSRARDD